MFKLNYEENNIGIYNVTSLKTPAQIFVHEEDFI